MLLPPHVVKLPAGQCAHVLHADAPVLSWKVPDVHAMHGVGDHGAEVYVPLAHAAQLPIVLTPHVVALPAGQLGHVSQLSTPTAVL
jgi:hypothetical protein